MRSSSRPATAACSSEASCRCSRRSLPAGGLAVLYDKNPMENTGYAAALADLAWEPVWRVWFPADDPSPSARFTPDAVLQVRTPSG